MAHHLCSGVRGSYVHVAWLDRQIQRPTRSWRFPWNAVGVVRNTDTHGPNHCSKRGDCGSQRLLRGRNREWAVLSWVAERHMLKRRSLALAASTYVCGVDGHLISSMEYLREIVCCVSIGCLVG